MLVLIVKLLFEFRDNILKLDRSDGLFRIEPKLLHEFGEANCEFSLGAEWIHVVDLIFEVASQEVL